MELRNGLPHVDTISDRFLTLASAPSVMDIVRQIGTHDGPPPLILKED